MIIKGPGGLGSWWRCGDYINDSIVENGLNTEKSPGDMRRLEETCSHSNFSERQRTKTHVKNSN